MELSRYYIVSVAEAGADGDLLPTYLFSKKGAVQLYVSAEEARGEIAKELGDILPDSLYFVKGDSEVVTADPRTAVLKRMTLSDRSCVVAWWSDGTRRSYTINEVQV